MMNLYIFDVVLKKTFSSFNPENPAADNILTSKNSCYETNVRL